MTKSKSTITGGNELKTRGVSDLRSNFYLVDLNVPISGKGVLNSWEIWADKVTPVQLVIYRKTANAWSVVGKSDLKTPALGLNQFALTTAIAVQPNDFAGVYYPQTGSVSFNRKTEQEAWDLGNLSGSVLFTSTGAAETAFSGSSNRVYSLKVHGIDDAPVFVPIEKPANGRIIVHNDEWALSDAGFQSVSDTATFALNVATYFVGTTQGKFHVLSNNFGLVGATLERTMTGAGHTWTKGMNIAINAVALAQYDAIFVGGDPVDNQVLIDYVKNGGKVYLCAGTGHGGSQAEAGQWNTFLTAFGLKFDGVYNNISGSLAVTSPSHPLFSNVKTLYQHNGNSISLLPNATANIVMTGSNQGLIATADYIKPNAPARSEPTPSPATSEPPKPKTIETEEFSITAEGDVFMSNLVYKGLVKKTQSDEYVELSNRGNHPVNISGWKITSVGSARQQFTFPANTVLASGKTFRVYTNEVHSETGGFSFASKTAIWNDAGDELNLYDAIGKKISTLAYGIARTKKS